MRELRNEIRKAALLTDSNHIREISLPVDAASNPPLENLTFLTGKILDKGISLREITRKTTEMVEKEIIEKALIQAKNNKTKAAKILKIDRMTLYSKIKSLGL